MHEKAVPSNLPSLAELQRADVLCLHMGELTRDELRIARAAVRFCYAKLVPLVDHDLSVRIARIKRRALELFGDEESAERWLSTSAAFVPGEPEIAPYDLATTEAGARLVESLLAKVAHGIY